MLKLNYAILFLASAAMFAAPSVFAGGAEVTPTVNAADKDFAAGKQAIEAKSWNNAILAFKRVVARDPKNADAHNFLGYANRWQGNMDESFQHYHEALKLNPNHKGANEYIGVAYLKINKPEKASEHLAKLEKICGVKCEEYEDLSKAIAEYAAKK